MSKQYYAFFLDDPATPDFVSCAKPCIGTEEELRTVMNRLQADGQYAESVKAVFRYLNGDYSAVHTIAYQERPALEPVEFITETKTILPEKEWEHLNAWKFPYTMKVSGAMISQIVVKLSGKYCRCIRAWMKDLSYKCMKDTWNTLNGGYWGNRSLLDVSESPNGQFTVNNLLYMVERKYDSIAEAVSDIQDLQKISFASICDEVFGNG